MDYKTVIYQPGTVARVIMNRPQYHNAQSTTLLKEMDDAFARAVADDQVKVIVLSGNGKHFSAGHDIGTPEMRAEWEKRGPARLTSMKYQREHFVEMSLRWRSLPKPTIGMIHGYCIFGGWLIASTMDILFASEDAQFLPSNLQYFTIPWDIGAKKAKEILFESRFITAQEAKEFGFVNKVFPREKLEEETLTYAQRVAEGEAYNLANSKFLVNQALDLMGFTNAVIAGFQTYAINILDRNFSSLSDGKKPRLDAVGLALRHSNAPEANRD